MKNYFKGIRRKDTGQVVLLLVLITIVGLTIGLSLISRTVTDIRISSQVEQSSRAFSAAEAGVENALKAAVATGPTISINLPGASANYSVSSVGGSTNVYAFPLTQAYMLQTLWVSGHDDTTNALLETPESSYPVDKTLEICWGSDPNKTPALLVTLLYKDTSANTYKISKLAFDSIDRGNNFYLANTVGSYCDGNYRFSKVIQATSSPPDGFGISASNTVLLTLRVQPLYEDAVIAIKPEVSLPVQGKLVISVGQTDTGVVRKVQALQGYPVLPILLDYTLFSEN